MNSPTLSDSISYLSRKILPVVIPSLLICGFPGVAQNSTIVIATKNTKESSTTQTNSEEELLDFSGTGRPGQQTAGDNRANCPYVNNSLTAITPISNFGKTVAKRPSFWFYTPYSSRQIKQAEFVLQDRKRKTIFRTSFELRKTPGYDRFSLPKTAPILETGQSYRWYVKVYCDRLISSADNSLSVISPLFIQGWIERVPLSSNLYLKLQNSPEPKYQVYGSNGIWYDAVNELLSQHLLEPHSLNLQQDWLKFAQAKGVDLQLPQLGTVESSHF